MTTREILSLERARTRAMIDARRTYTIIDVSRKPKAWRDTWTDSYLLHLERKAA